MRQLSLFEVAPSWHDAQQPFTFYATFDSDSECSYIPEGTSVLLPASSYARDNLRRPRLPGTITDRAADCGGYVASRVWGEYRYTLDQYVSWLRSWSPCWAATMDYCCEPELAQMTRDRQEKTTANALEAWTRHKQESWVWVPTIQGLYPDDYRRHAYELKPLIEEMSTHYAELSTFRVGIGTLCRRDDVTAVQAVVDAVREVLPSVPLHLWGIKLDALRSVSLHNVASSDSAVWSGMMYGARDMAEKAKEVGMSRRKYSVLVNLPSYQRRVLEAVEESKRVQLAQSDHALLDQARRVLRSQGWTINVRTRRNRQYVYAAKRRGAQVLQVHICPVSELGQWLCNPVVQVAS